MVAITWHLILFSLASPQKFKEKFLSDKLLTFRPLTNTKFITTGLGIRIAIPVCLEISINLSKIQLQKKRRGEMLWEYWTLFKKNNHRITVESIYSPNPCINKDFASEESWSIS